MEEKIKQTIEPIIKKEGYVLEEAYFSREGGRKSLVVIIDSDKGIGVNDCAKISKLIDPILEEKEILKEKHFLIVSSPGKESSGSFF